MHTDETQIKNRPQISRMSADFILLAHNLRKSAKSADEKSVFHLCQSVAENLWLKNFSQLSTINQNKL